MDEKNDKILNYLVVKLWKKKLGTMVVMLAT